MNMEVKKLDSLMTEEQMKEEIARKKQEYTNKVVGDFNEGILHIINYNGVSKFKSVRRAMRRGKVDLFTGVVYPRRHFNNRKPSKGRRFNELRKEVYGEITRKEI